MKIHSSIKAAVLSISALATLGCQQTVDQAEKTSGAQTLSKISEGGDLYELETVVEGLDIPWGIAFTDRGMLITEKVGKLILITTDGEKQLISGLPSIWQQGQGGLLDITLDPDYENQPWIYLSYSSEGETAGSGTTTIAKAQLVEDRLEQFQVLYRGTEDSEKGFHFGSRIVFDKEGYLYFSIGDRGNRDENPQSIKRDGGKIYRIHKDGSIPSDNPFVGIDGAKEAIWSYGHRNPQGMIYHPEFDEIWVHEHGPQGGDEINAAQKGSNYGWPVISYGINYDGSSFTDKTALEGMEQPLYYWIPSIAPSGMLYVHSDKYPELNGSIFSGSLKFQYLERLIFEGKQAVKRERWFENIGRVREITQGPDGYIYIAVEGKGIFKIVPKTSES